MENRVKIVVEAWLTFIEAGNFDVREAMIFLFQKKRIKFKFKFDYKNITVPHKYIDFFIQPFTKSPLDTCNVQLTAMLDCLNRLRSNKISNEF